MPAKWSLACRRITAIILCCIMAGTGTLADIPVQASERTGEVTVAARQDTGADADVSEPPSLRAEGNQDALFGSLLVWFLIISVVSISLLIS